MITKHSINLAYVEEVCYAKARDGSCIALIREDERCGTYRCPFYKPKDCKSWIRIEDRSGVNLIPPEEVGIRRKK